MNQVKKIKELQGLSFFDKGTLSQFFELSENSLSANIKRWLKAGILIQLKKGLYVASEYVKTQRNRDAYLESVANKLREPSYLSLEYVLQKNNILTEGVYGFTSVTLKSKRIYQNSFGVFVYRNMKRPLFEGYTIDEVDGFRIRTATKAKALFDYLYYKLFRIPEINVKMLEDLRLNLENLSRREWEEFSKYCRLAGTRKMAMLKTLLRKTL